MASGEAINPVITSFASPPEVRGIAGIRGFAAAQLAVVSSKQAR